MALSGLVKAPTSFRLAVVAQDAYDLPLRDFGNTHDAHPAIGHLCLLVFEAVLEVVVVSLPGYIIARLGQFDSDKQKFLANLNVSLFTPCLIFTKLASQLNADKLSDLAIIPVIFIAQTLISWIVSKVVVRLFGFGRRASNFVTAMGVFGNSNSLPISLVISLAQTLKGLHWDKIPGDNDDEVAARGILYLLIFQQLGQLVRWSWGYHVLLAPKHKYPEYQEQIAEEGQYRDHEDLSVQAPLIEGLDSDDDSDTRTDDSRGYDPAGRTPDCLTSRGSMSDLDDNNDDDSYPSKNNNGGNSKKLSQSLTGSQPALPESNVMPFPRVGATAGDSGSQNAWSRTKAAVGFKFRAVWLKACEAWISTYESLPKPVRAVLALARLGLAKVNNFLWEFMNPPLWAMIFAVLVASVPSLQSLFFEEGSFVKNSVTDAIESSGGVAVPLILVVLGANLARSTSPANDMQDDPEEEAIGTRLLVASLICRMVLPTAIMAPLLAVTAKYVAVSILADPIFVIVCFLLSGAPSALQLAQICQINNVYEKVMGRILFQSYVVWVLPSTLMLVMLALETVEWTK
ncbi:Membrane transport protein [Geosmithia morbida]|uniref:Membrane transport protein n=1 Tax=Geosmithia morbida TaxID=1094350 RepID=A0A9P4YZA1_9HYPO|nr:Membrane transport protein [Geosmithia morbida]KAF4124496.1 Membrane transport protein [Geosmithia morbida]